MDLEMTIPDGVTPYVGFRSWGFAWYPRVMWEPLQDRGHLRAMNNVLSIWSDAGPTEATCEPSEYFKQRHQLGPCTDVSPNENCKHGCGLHAFHGPEILRSKYKRTMPHMSSGLKLFGAVLGWGQMVRHQDEGWRAQYAVPIAILRPDGALNAPHRGVRRMWRDLEDMQADLGFVFTRNWKELETFAYNKGARWVSKPIIP